LSSRKRFRRATVGVLATAALGVSVVAGLGPLPGGTSSHREAPAISLDPAADTTDVWMFVSPTNPNNVVMIGSWYPFEEPSGGPNFYVFDPNARYDFKISNDDDAAAELIYRATFTNHVKHPDTFLYNIGPVTTLGDPDLNFFQTWDLQRIKLRPGKKPIKTLVVNDEIVAPSNVGAASMPNYTALSNEAIVGSGDTMYWAGQSDDAFFVDLRAFDLLFGLDLSEVGDDTLTGFNVQSIAIEVPASKLTGAAGDVIGMWSTVSRPSTRVQETDGDQSFTGPFRQISRLAMPLVNEVVIPLRDKDLFNASSPAGDLANFASYIVEPEFPTLIEAVYGIPAPATPRDDLVAVFATGVEGLNVCCGVGEMLRLNTAIPPCEPVVCPEFSALGVIGGDLAGYPNGRRLYDDVLDITVQVAEGELVGNPNDLGDAVDANDVSFRIAFPYLALPHSGSAHMHHNSQI
jgi:hypothetical protein